MSAHVKMHVRAVGPCVRMLAFVLALLAIAPHHSPTPACADQPMPGGGSTSDYVLPARTQCTVEGNADYTGHDITVLPMTANASVMT